MKIFKNVSAVVLVVALVFSLSGPIKPVFALGVAPSLGNASSFGVLAGAAVSDTATSSDVAGDVGLSPTGGTGITVLSCTEVTGTIYDTNAGYTGGHDSNTGCLITDAGLLTTTKSDVSSAYNDVEGQVSDFPVVASTTDSFAAFGYVLTPGVYSSGSTMGVPVALTLDGGGDPDAVFIFQAGTTLNTVAGSTITLINGAHASNIFWQVGTSATFGVGSDFKGTVMAAVSITDTGGSTILGRLLADADNTDADSTGAVTLNNTSITVPTTLHVIKVVVNSSGGTAVESDFNVHVTSGGVDVAGSPAPGVAAPGTAYELSAGAYVVSEDPNPLYVQTFLVGDCDASGNVTLATGDDKVCTIINTDIPPPPPVVPSGGGGGGGGSPPVPPLISIEKVPTPLSLPSGAGSVTYNYTVSNIGTVAMRDIQVSDNACSVVNFLSGDTDGDSELDISEDWNYSCTMTLTGTTTNTVTATGRANGFTVADIATATVVVGVPVIPPLIHIVKTPNVFLLPAGGGAVTYGYTVTNPGTEPLSDVNVVDDKCTGLPGRVTGHPGDLNQNNLLESSEIWSFTCQTFIGQTTTNTGTARGTANGLIAIDFALATVAVSAPGLPNTGLPSQGVTIVVGILMLGAAYYYFFVRRKQA